MKIDKKVNKTKKNIQIFIVISLLFLISFFYTNCEGGKVVNNSAAPESSVKIIPDTENKIIDETEYSQNEEKEIAQKFSLNDFGDDGEEYSYFSVMTGEELLQSYSIVTKVPYVYEQASEESVYRVSNDRFFSIWGYGKLVNAFYNNVLINLPIESNADKFNSSHLNSIVSLSSSFCEEVFIGNHPVSGEPYLNLIPDIDINNDLPSESDQVNFINLLLNWLVPNRTVNESGKKLLLNYLNNDMAGYSELIESRFREIFFHTDGRNRDFRFKALNPQNENMITFKDSFFVSYFIMPEDSAGGFDLPTSYNDKGKIKFSNSKFEINFQHELVNQNIVGYITMIDISRNKTRLGKFIINDGLKNNMDYMPYHVVFEYNNQSDSDHFSVVEDIRVYVNDEQVNIVGVTPYFWADVYSSVDFKPLKSIPFIGTSEISGSSMIPFQSNILVYADNRLSFANIEVYEGLYSPFIAINKDNSYYFNVNGKFTFVNSEEKVNLRNPFFFLGKVIDENDENDLVILKTLDGKISYLQINSTVPSTKNVTIEGLTAVNQFNNDVRVSQLNDWVVFNNFRPEIIIPKPYVLFTPFLCTAILSSQYFIFN